MIDSSFYERDQLDAMGFASIGQNVLISKYARFYGIDKIYLGSNLRIDDFCIITASKPVTFGSYIHVSAYSSIYGAAGFEARDFVTISGRVAIYTESDDYSGRSLTNPTVPSDYKPGYLSESVILEEYSIVGAGSTILPGVSVGKGASIGAHSFVRENCAAWGVFAGVPAKKIGVREVAMLDLAARFKVAKNNS